MKHQLCDNTTGGGGEAVWEALPLELWPRLCRIAPVHELYWFSQTHKHLLPLTAVCRLFRQRVAACLAAVVNTHIGILYTSRKWHPESYWQRWFEQHARCIHTLDYTTLYIDRLPPRSLRRLHTLKKIPLDVLLFRFDWLVLLPQLTTLTLAWTEPHVVIQEHVIFNRQSDEHITVDRYGNQFLSDACRLSHLELLNFSLDDMRDANLVALTCLQTLKLRRCLRVEQFPWHTLPTQLQKLTIDNCAGAIDEKCLRHLPSLHTLHLQWFNMPDAQCLSVLTGLTDLSVVTRQPFTCAGLGELKNLTALSLSLGGADTTGTALLQLAPQLKQLSVSRTPSNLDLICPLLTQLAVLNVSDAQDHHMHLLTSVTSLSLDNDQISGETLQQLTQLRTLILYDMGYIEDKHLTALTQLETLHIYGSAYTQVTAATFRCLTRLSTLHLSTLYLDDAALHSLSHLTVLQLRENDAVSVDGLSALQSLTQLELTGHMATTLAGAIASIPSLTRVGVI
jgi:hypothetical protein